MGTYLQAIETDAYERGFNAGQHDMLSQCLDICQRNCNKSDWADDHGPALQYGDRRAKEITEQLRDLLHNISSLNR